MSTPSVGRVVHLVADDGECLAAIVTKVQNVLLPDALDRSLLLTVFAPSGPTIFAAPFNADNQVSTWHWPERVE